MQGLGCYCFGVCFRINGNANGIEVNVNVGARPMNVAAIFVNGEVFSF
jgi:hypothetical protein